MKKLSIVALVTVGLTGCFGGTGPTSQQIIADLQTAALILKEAGCVTHEAANMAAPIIKITADANGNAVLQEIDATGTVICSAPAPTTLASSAGTTLGVVLKP
jgi:hypothetical protein